MTSKFSAYLDIVRFTAALLVFLGHASTGYMTGGLFWQLAPYGDTCVVVFFVLSGFVIGYVADTKDATWELYLSNRAARLWSVVLPALVLTFAVDLFGVRAAPAIYDGPWYLGDHLALRYLASALMLQETWHLWLVPGINGPFWSLTYEAFYYAVFGVLYYSRAKFKWLIAALLLVAGGPLIAALAPLWFIGYGVYRMTRRQALPLLASALLFVGGLAILLAAPLTRAAFLHHDLMVMHDPMLGRYLDALGIFANLLGAHGLASAGTWQLSPRLRSAIAFVAGSTFVLYLFHRPLIQLFSFIGPSDPSSWGRRLLVLGGTLLIAIAAEPMTEQLRRRLRAGLYRVLRPPTPAPAVT